MAMNAISKVVDNIVGHRDVADAQPRPLRSETEMMRAVTWQGKRSMKVTDIGKPLITHQSDAIVKVMACAICSGSDGEMYAGEVPTMDAGFVMGHECMGIIESVGGSVSKFQVGQRVAVSCLYRVRIMQPLQEAAVLGVRGDEQLQARGEGFWPRTMRCLRILPPSRRLRWQPGAVGARSVRGCELLSDPGRRV
jgi:hypothetical protein